MTFYREGKKINYLEVIETLDELVKKDILTQLQEQEIKNFYVRIFDFTKEMVTIHLEKLGYKVINARQSFLTLVQLKEISNYEVWDQAIQLYDTSILGESSKDDIVKFMSQTLSSAMKDLNTKLNKLSR